SHPELLDLLARGFAESGQDLKPLFRAICNSQTYQRTSRGGPRTGADPSLLDRMPVKSMRPEMLYDSLSIVLYPPVRKPGGKGATTPILPGAIPGTSREEFAAFFAVGQAREGGSVVNPGIPQVLRLMNGPILARESPGLTRFLGPGSTSRRIGESLYLAAYSRRPTPEEAQLLETHLSGSDGPDQGAAGVLWALLNSSEFALNP
ncbi:MAG TPA: DUF1553 domain-containing protein, partial [Planctomycetota bacterium]|nr:DUF1553 domain-containing protein [Planctomycetota bacterium]